MGLETGSNDGCTAMWIPLMLLNCALKMLFVVCTFHCGHFKVIFPFKRTNISECKPLSGTGLLARVCIASSDDWGDTCCYLSRPSCYFMKVKSFAWVQALEVMAPVSTSQLCAGNNHRRDFNPTFWNTYRHTHTCMHTHTPPACFYLLS